MTVVFLLCSPYCCVQSKEAGEVLQAYYQAQRRCGQRSESRTTIRMLESLVRLAQAHARLCMRGTVSLQDAVVVVNTMATSMDGADGEAEPWPRAFSRLSKTFILRKYYATRLAKVTPVCACVRVCVLCR